MNSTSELRSFHMPTTAPPVTAHAPIYTRRPLVTIIYVIIALWAASWTIFWTFDVIRLVVMWINHSGPSQLNTIDYIVFIFYVGLIPAFVTIAATSVRVIWSPHFLYRENKEAFGHLVPLIIAVIYYILDVTIIIGAIEPDDVVAMPILVSAIVGMLRPRSESIFAILLRPIL